MPNLDDIRRFNDTLVSVGKEAQILAAKGEAVEIPDPESSGVDSAGSDIEALLSDISDEEPQSEGSPEESPFDFGNSPLEEFDIGEGDVPGLRPAPPTFDEELSPEGEEAEPAFDLETFDFDTSNYSEEEQPQAEGVPEIADESIEELANLFDTGAETFDFDLPEPEAAETNAEQIPAEPFDGDVSAAEPVQGAVFEAPDMNDTGDFDDASFEIPEIDESAFEQMPEPEEAFAETPVEDMPAEDAAVQDVPDAEASPVADSAVEDVGEFDSASFDSGDFDEFEPESPVDEVPDAIPAGSPGEAPNEFSFDLEEDDLSGLEFETDAAAGEDEFEIPVAPGQEEIEAPFTPADEEELARQAAVSVVEEEPVEDLDVDEFNLGDFGAEFGVLENQDAARSPAAISEEELNPAVSIGMAEGGGPGASAGMPGAVGEVSLSDKQFTALKRTLSLLPLNLKISVEEIIGDGKGSAEQLRQLINLLVAGAPVQQVANLASRIVGKRILIPRGYQKRSGVAFEQERQSLAYRFRENILPILRVFVAGTLALGLLVFVGYRYVYRPLYAQSLYQRGFNEIPTSQYTRANGYFSQALAIWPMKDWFFRYAAAFTGQHQYILAEEKYDQLLKYYPFDKHGTLTYAAFESRTLANYEKARSILRSYLDKKGNDPEVFIALGDNFMLWAETDPSKYEEARRAYAFVIQHFGPSDMLYMRMLRYFIRTDNQTEVLRLKNYFQADKGRKIDPEVYAELGGYLLDKNQLQDVRDVLFRALSVNDRVPEIHYELARYFKRVSDPTEEATALKLARDLYNKVQPLDKRQMGQLVDTYGRLGALYYAQGSDIPAQEALTSGIRRYEGAKQAGILSPKPQFGRLYSTLGDIFYYKALDYTQALNAYQQSLGNGYSSPDLHYKIGFIHYRNGAYETALKDFTSAAGTISTDRNLTYAMANALYMRKDYFAAQGYYADLLDRLRSARQQIQNLDVSRDSAQRSLIEYLIRASNNMGVTMYRLWQRTGRQQDYTDALVYLKDSTEEATNLNRNAETAVRSSAVDLAHLNIRGIIYPEATFVPQIYKQIPVDMKSLFLGAPGK